MKDTTNHFVADLSEDFFTFRKMILPSNNTFRKMFLVKNNTFRKMFLAQNDTFRKMFEHFWHFEGGLFLSINNPFVFPINYPHLCSTKNNLLFIKHFRL